MTEGQPAVDGTTDSPKSTGSVTDERPASCDCPPVYRVGGARGGPFAAETPGVELDLPCAPCWFDDFESPNPAKLDDGDDGGASA